jgi:hypothetical protein
MTSPHKASSEEEAPRRSSRGVHILNADTQAYADIVFRKPSPSQQSSREHRTVSLERRASPTLPQPLWREGTGEQRTISLERRASPTPPVPLRREGHSVPSSPLLRSQSQPTHDFKEVARQSSTPNILRQQRVATTIRITPQGHLSGSPPQGAAKSATTIVAPPPVATKSGTTAHPLSEREKIQPVLSTRLARRTGAANLVAPQMSYVLPRSPTPSSDRRS